MKQTSEQTHAVNTFDCVISTFRVKCLGTGFSASAEHTERVCDFLLILGGGNICVNWAHRFLFLCVGEERRRALQRAIR